MIAPPWAWLGVVAVVFVVGYMFGFTAGASSAKAEILERVHFGDPEEVEHEG